MAQQPHVREGNQPAPVVAGSSRVRSRLPSWLPYGVGISLTAGIGLIRWTGGLDAGAEEIFLFPVAVSAFLGGLWPGLLATVLAGTFSNLEFLPSLSDWSVRRAEAEWVLLVLVGVLISVLTEALHRSRARARQARQQQDVTLACIGDGVVTTDVAGRITFMNPAASRLTGWAAAEATGHEIGDVFRLLAVDAVEAMENPLRTVLQDGAAARLDEHAVLVARDGREIPIAISAAPIRPDDGEPVGVALVLRDSSDAWKAERAMADRLAARQELARVVATAPGILFTFRLRPDGTTCLPYASPGVRGIFGLEAEALEESAEPVFELMSTEDANELRLSIAESARSMTPWRGEFRITRRDGATLWVEGQSVPVAEPGEGVLWHGYINDVTERHKVEAALRSARETARRDADVLEEREARLAGIINSAMDAIITVDEQQRIVLANPAAQRIFRWSATELIGQPLSALIPARYRATHERHVRAYSSNGHTSRRIDGLQPLAGLRSDGEEFPMEATISHIEVGGHRLATAILRDVTLRVRTEEAMRASEERFHQLAESIREVFWLANADFSRIEYVSPAFETIWGRPCAEVIASTRVWRDSVHEMDRERLGARAARMTEGSFEEEYRIVRPDGAVRWIRDRAFPVRKVDGEVIGIAGVAEDITERRELQAQLLQAQKLESIGLLAGGVAHDFNNWLTVISANSELAIATMPPEHQAVEFITEIRHAGERAAGLTRQLLTFSRQEVTEPREMDLNAAVADTEKLLCRLIGEDIQLETHLRAVSRVMADPGHVSQILMNLAVNARDAMSSGGRLMIDTADVVLEPGASDSLPRSRTGRFVRLRFADTGAGMPPDVRERIFEPFFTTKGIAKGTGLGLAVVHGIVEQCGGRIHVSSEVGSGTVFVIHFPAVVRSVSATTAPDGTTHVGGRETILLVEDDDSLRLVASRSLRGAGYTVLEAADGRQALRIVARHGGGIELLLTDVVMPGMGGRALADEIRRHQPRTRVLFSSGYLDDSIVRHGVAQAEVAFLQKPYDAHGLLARVRQVLDRPVAIVGG